MIQHSQIGLWLCILLLLGGCAPAREPLPTLLAVAPFPTDEIQHPDLLAQVPATYTPPSGTFVPSLTPLPTSTFTPIPTLFVSAGTTPAYLPILTFTPSPSPPPSQTPLPTDTPFYTLTPSSTPPPSLTPTSRPTIQYSAGIPYYDIPPTSVPCGDKGLVFRSQFYANADGLWHSYHAYLPACYGHDGRTYPVLYLIHGSIQTDTHWLNLGLRYWMDTSIANGNFPPAIVIMPYNDRLGNISSGGARSVEGMFLNDLMPYVDRYFCDWPSRTGRSIGGISRGGYWALEIAFRQAWLFKGVAGHSSHLRFETDAVEYNPLATYATHDLSGLRIWLDLGEDDFLRPGQEQLHNNLLNAGIPHEFVINPGGHNNTYWARHLPTYLTWHMAGWSPVRNLYPSCS